MFALLMDGAAWIFVIGIAALILMFALAGAGALIGNALAWLMRDRAR